jgi:hypothetical protein
VWQYVAVCYDEGMPAAVPEDQDYPAGWYIGTVYDDNSIRLGDDCFESKEDALTSIDMWLPDDGHGILLVGIADDPT